MQASLNKKKKKKREQKATTKKNNHTTETHTQSREIYLSICKSESKMENIPLQRHVSGTS